MQLLKSAQNCTLAQSRIGCNSEIILTNMCFADVVIYFLICCTQSNATHLFPYNNYIFIKF